jgi:hypothetical protein
MSIAKAPSGLLSKQQIHDLKDTKMNVEGEERIFNICSMPFATKANASTEPRFINPGGISHTPRRQALLEHYSNRVKTFYKMFKRRIKPSKLPKIKVTAAYFYDNAVYTPHFPDECTQETDVGGQS